MFMARTKKTDKQIDTQNNNKTNLDESFMDVPDEAKEKLEQIKSKIESFKDKVLKRFEDHILGITLLPPSKDEEKKDKINLLVLVDDSDSTKMTKDELRDKISSIVSETAKNVDETLSPDTLLLTDLWQSCYDAKYDLLQMIATSAIIFDKGMMAAIKLSEVHKTMVLKKFEKYIVSYVLAGSLVQGKATPESDIDVFLVIDDTDVKKMTRTELRDKLRAIIIGMGIDAGKMTGIENKINIQVYILTDFWESIKEANPVIFTFLRDGIPLYDRGIFMPWKQLLQMGRIKPSPEAIDMFMHSGDQMLERVKYKLKEIGMEDFFWAAITTSQAALMLYGFPPPTPKETPETLRQIFVKKEKLLEEKYVKIVEKVLKVRKDMEHGTKKDIDGKEVDDLYTSTQEFLERMKKLFEEIDSLKQKQEVEKIFTETMVACREALRLEGLEDFKEADIVNLFDKHLVKKAKIYSNAAVDLKDIIKAKKEHETAKLSKPEINKSIKESRAFIRNVVEYIQRTRARELESSKIRIKYGDKIGELLVLNDAVFVISNLESPEQEIRKGKISEKGVVSGLSASNVEDLESALADSKNLRKVFINESLYNSIKQIFGDKAELIIGY